MKSPKNILVIAPHMDDEVLGMGGTIARHVEHGDSVHVCFVAHRIYEGNFDKTANQREMGHAKEAQKVLGYTDARFLNLNDERLDVAIQDIIKPLESYIEEVKPQIVYSSFYGDNNQDHRAVFQAVRVAIRPFAKVAVHHWYLYETPSSTDQSPPIIEAAFMPNHYVNISNLLAKKIEAFKCYETEMRKPPHPRSVEAVTALSVKRGSEIGMLKAEAFMNMRSVWE